MRNLIQPPITPIYGAASPQNPRILRADSDGPAVIFPPGQDAPGCGHIGVFGGYFASAGSLSRRKAAIVCRLLDFNEVTLGILAVDRFDMTSISTGPRMSEPAHTQRLAAARIRASISVTSTQKWVYPRSNGRSGPGGRPAQARCTGTAPDSNCRPAAYMPRAAVSGTSMI